MIKVRGIDFRTVELRDIADRVYYGQEKIFSDNQYNSSPELKKAIEAGKLFVMDHKVESYPGFKAPVQNPEVVQPAVPVDDGKMDAILGVIRELSDKVAVIQQKSGQEVMPPAATPATGTGVETALQSLAVQVAGIQEALKNKNDISSSVVEQLDRVEESVRGITVSGAGVRSVETKSSRSTVGEEVYVPSSFQVDDMTNRVKLETKSLGQGGTVNSSLAKLRELNKNNNQK